jgi:hypothetical protein
VGLAETPRSETEAETDVDRPQSARPHDATRTLQRPASGPHVVLAAIDRLVSLAETPPPRRRVSALVDRHALAQTVEHARIRTVDLVPAQDLIAAVARLGPNVRTDLSSHR